jgi:hypothetical protein
MGSVGPMHLIPPIDNHRIVTSLRQVLSQGVERCTRKYLHPGQVQIPPPQIQMQLVGVPGRPVSAPRR